MVKRSKPKKITTKEEDIFESYKRGTSVDELADEYQKSKSTIYRIIKRVKDN